MSYARIGFDSDVYVIHHVGGGMACYCGEVNGDTLMSKPDMIEHLLQHRADGWRVPQRALDRLYREIAEEERRAEEGEDDES